jgi:hypothetical protein
MSSTTESAAALAKRYTAKEPYALYRASLVAVVSVNAQSDESVGAAFHVGDGFFVTARHVVEKMVSCRVEIDYTGTHQFANKTPDELGDHNFLSFPIEPHPHPDPQKDVAAFAVPKLAKLPVIPLGGHLDDWINDHDFVLNEVLVLGFPPVPLANKNVLVATCAHVSAVVDIKNVKQTHFIV